MFARLTGMAPVLLLVGAGCGHPGRLLIPDAQFSPSDTRLVLATSDSGTVVMDLEGHVLQRLSPPGQFIVDASADLQRFVLTDSDTNLYLAERGGEPRRIPALDRRVSEAVLSPDGRTVAATRHANYDLPQEQWRDDDAVHLIDVETGDVRVLPASTDAMPVGLAWEKDGGALWVTLRFLDGPPFRDAYVRVETSSGARMTAAEPVATRLHRSAVHLPVPPCGSRQLTLEPSGWRGDQGLLLLSADAPVRHLVVVSGRERGFHDHRETTGLLAFTPGCGHALFFFDGDTWAVDVQTAALRRLGRGTPQFFDHAAR